MPRSLLKKWLPNPQKIRETPGLGFLGKMLDDPNLFHLNRHSVSVAFFIGLFVGLLPIPGIQSYVVAAIALVLRCNLPLSIALIWITNPLTIPFIFWAEWKLGSWLLGDNGTHYGFDFTWEWFTTIFPHVWAPLLLGSVVTALFFGSLFYFLTHWLWRWHVMDKWHARKHRKNKKKQDTTW